MNNISKIGLLSAVALLASCSEKDMLYVPAAGQGEEVVFTFKDDPGSRTMYQDDWDATTNQQLYWGNYISQEKDQVKIFCKAASNQIATYNVNAKTENSNEAESLEKTGTAGVQWGQKGTAHNFYAFYPASAAGNAFVNGTDNTIHAQVSSGQSPVTYKAVVANGTTWTDNALVQVNNNKTANPDYATTIYGQPDMSAAIMVAKTEVSGTPDASSQTGYGYPVPLHFNVLADVLDITINGPVKPNTLLDNNANPDAASRDYITINSVTVKAKDGKTIICGDFDLDMAKGTASNVSGNTSIQLVTSDGKNSPVLFVRADVESPKPSDLDHLRLRAFLIPGQIKNLNELQITLSTDCGEYTQDLGADAMVSGKIHPIKLGYFKKRGTQFDFSKWMGQLDPNIYISELSLPGTWHSSVDIFQGSGNNTLSTQYAAGIRAFEVHAYNAVTITRQPTYSTYTQTEGPKTDYTDDRDKATVNRSFRGNSRTGTCSREVTVTRMVITVETANATSEAAYEMSLKNFDNHNNLTESFTSLKDLINQKEFVVVEIGMEGQTSVDLPIAKTRTTTVSSTATVTQTGTSTRSYSYYDGYTYTDQWNEIDYSSISNWSAGNTETKEDEQKKSVLDGGAAWVKAVSDMCITLANNGVVYKEQITPNTTISDVAGKIIIKVNTNGENMNETGWPARTPALFSRWTNGSISTPLNVGLNWGQPALASGNPMIWCFTEQDNIGNDIKVRKDAVDLMNQMSIENYKLGNHSTWYECQIGGYLKGLRTDANCQAVATEMNPYLIQVLSNPNRQACPLGLILMNYALDANYSGPELIRAIINNNAAFILARRTGAGNNASDNTNSSFNSNNGNPLK